MNKKLHQAQLSLKTDNFPSYPHFVRPENPIVVITIYLYPNRKVQSTSSDPISSDPF
jgi:hypothetical protein